MRSATKTKILAFESGMVLIKDRMAAKVKAFVRRSRMAERISVVMDPMCILTGRDKVRALHRIADEFEQYPECAEGVEWCRSHRVSDYRF